MGEIVKRPIKEGVGERPKTPKPEPMRAMAGERPHTPKPARTHADGPKSPEKK